MRLPMPKLSLSLAGLLVCGASHAVWAAEEIGEPAGALPDSAELPEIAPTEDAAPVEDYAPVENDQVAKPAPTASTKKMKTEAQENKNQENWDSYSDAGTGGVAQEITKGVRVEDIVEPPSDYRYAAFGKADPFVPPMVTSEKPIGPGNLEIPIVSPLQRFDVMEMDLVGVWQLSTGERKAMILTPGNQESGGQGIIVKNGDPIGKRGGKILGIGDDFLTVREFMLAADGTRQYEDQQMYMGKRSPDDLPGKIIFKPGQPQTEVKIEGDGPTQAPTAEGVASKGISASGSTRDGAGKPGSFKNGSAQSPSQGQPTAGGSAPIDQRTAPATAYKSIQPAAATPSSITPSSAAPSATITPPSTIQGNQPATPVSTGPTTKY